MERKRKLPARAAARVEQVAKKSRTATPPEHRSAIPAPAPTPIPEEEMVPKKPPAQPLPKSVQPGKPLPTVEDAQPEDLSIKDFQSIQESGVLAESLARSRQRWATEGLFEKYWSKPIKKKGVVHEEPNNPPKDSMTKVGQVTIIAEPHKFEVTMFAVKDPKPPAPQPVFRPIMQYGPPNGAMHAPPTPVPAASTSPANPAVPKAQAPTQPQIQTPNLASSQPQPSPAPRDASTEVPPAAAASSKPTVASPRGMESVLAPNPAMSTNSPRPMASHTPQSIPSPVPASTGPTVPPSYPASLPNRSPAPVPTAPTPSGGTTGASATPAPPAPPTQPAGTDPIIVTLAAKANGDPALRDLMKRVAQGHAPKDELGRFQAIIDQITAESKKKGTLQGPSADRLLVDGKTVRYFADEVRVILDIVLRSDPKQTSANLRPPGGSDPLVVALVKTALDDIKTSFLVRRIAENKPQFSDATDLKAVLEQLKTRLIKERDLQKVQSPAPVAGSGKAIGASHVQHDASAGLPQVRPTPAHQALRSKGPPLPLKPDVSAIVFEFAGGSGDRFRFPKYSILEYIQTPLGQQVIASFLVVRKGSASEYDCDPSLDYYQPVTIRLSSPSGKHLEYLSKVVAPPEEVRRYMEDIMSTMTRAEYIVLAMRLPRGDKDTKEYGQGTEKDKTEEMNGLSSEAEDRDACRRSGPSSFTWKTEKGIKQPPAKLPSKVGGKRNMNEDQQYQSFIASVSRKETEDKA